MSWRRLKNDTQVGDHCSPGNNQSFRNGFYAFMLVKIVSLESTKRSLEFMACFLSSHSRWAVEPHTSPCPFLHCVQSIQSTAGGLHSSSSEHISSVIKANRMHLTAIWSVTNFAICAKVQQAGKVSFVLWQMKVFKIKSSNTINCAKEKRSQNTFCRVCVNMT